MLTVMWYRTLYVGKIQIKEKQICDYTLIMQIFEFQFNLKTQNVARPASI